MTKYCVAVLVGHDHFDRYPDRGAGVIELVLHGWEDGAVVVLSGELPGWWAAVGKRGVQARDAAIDLRQGCVGG